MAYTKRHDTEYTLYIDVDDVIADFATALSEAFGLTYEQVLKEWPVGLWSMHAPLIKALKRNNLPCPPDEPIKFWDYVSNTYQSFWENIPTTKWASAIIKECLRWTNDIQFVSAPPKNNCINFYVGRAVWLKKVTGIVPRFMLTDQKWRLARHRRCILVDDSEENVDDFRAAGGSSILFPRHQNKLHMEKHRPVEWVHNQLSILIGGVSNGAFDP